MPLAFAPACLPVLWGGLPHATAHDAVALVAAVTPDIPAWPAVPERSFRETPMAQAAAGFPGLTIDPAYHRISVDHAAAEIGLDRLGLAYLRGDPGLGALPSDHAAGLGELLRLVGHGHRARALKGTVRGPVSLALQLTDEDERPLAYDPALREALIHHLSLRLAWHYEQLSTYTDSVILCLDEPFLDALSLPLCPIERDEGVDMIDRLLDTMAGCRGISVGAGVDWEALLMTSVDLVMFDANEHIAELTRSAASVSQFLDRGGILGWGVVPADAGGLDQATAAALARQVEFAADQIAAVGDVSRQNILESSLITSCGDLSALPVDTAEAALRMCAAVSQRLRDVHGLGKEPMADSRLPIVDSR
ncbi:hypothetical protein K2Z83_00690 [Oscillochloris sp. ZM17-4]|uniref:hypothetical protein n=1 Tax=Oscillochloris sp. ZM17-4 TaxID=2866714 RepID=UPI001C72DF6C|nr:hypothetical protein [Oscillochloris sp. ZM17-4]MBX0326209.1 hypothetical protein [Oscillochloris sp. ZM17-4]